MKLSPADLRAAYLSLKGKKTQLPELLDDLPESPEALALAVKKALGRYVHAK